MEDTTMTTGVMTTTIMTIMTIIMEDGEEVMIMAAEGIIMVEVDGEEDTARGLDSEGEGLLRVVFWLMNLF